MAAPPPPFANDGSFLERFKEMQKAEQPSAASTDASEAAAEPPAPTAAEKKPDDSDFEPSTSFEGARESFVFKTGGCWGNSSSSSVMGPCSGFLPTSHSRG
jgi:hypothetical protein